MKNLPIAWMVKWTKGKSMYVHCHDDETAARDQARLMRGGITPLYAEQPISNLRDDFAKASLSVIGGQFASGTHEFESALQVARNAYLLADAMVAVREHG